MKLAGTYTFDAPRQRVWDLLMDPAVLRRIIPGCERLEEVGPDTYSADIKLGIANVRGDYTGTVTISDQQPPTSYRLAGEGRGKPGFAKGSGGLELSEADGKTTMRYQADIAIGGAIASVGQRLIDAAAKSVINQSLKALAAEVEAPPPAQPEQTPEPSPASSDTPDAAPAADVAPSAAPTVRVTATPTVRVTPAPAAGLSATDVARGMAEDFVAEQPWMRWVGPLVVGFALGLVVGQAIGSRQD